MTLKKAERKERYVEMLGAMLNNRLDDAFSMLKKMYADDVSCFFLGHTPKFGWQPIETAPDGEKKVRVGWYSNGVWVESVDVKLDGVWLGHGDEYNHYHTTSEEAPPYKYWMEYTHPPKERVK